MPCKDEGRKGKANHGMTLTLRQELSPGAKDGIQASGPHLVMQGAPLTLEIIIFLLDHGINLILRANIRQSLTHGSILEQPGDPCKGSQVNPGTVFRSDQEEKKMHGFAVH
jgi:hypothetical protein